MAGYSDEEKHKSMKGLQEAWPCEGDFFLNWKDKGYNNLLNILQKDKNLDILLNKEVDNIRWRADKISSGEADPLVQVKCKDNSLYVSKHVIITVPIAVLQERSNELFSPPLPSKKIKTINSIASCVLDKIYLEFDKPWWPISPYYIHILWKNIDKAVFSHAEQWTTEIFALSSVEFQPNLLCAWIYGKGAEDMENVSIDRVKTDLEKLLNALFEKHFNVTKIKAVVRSEWAKNSFIRGAYSYRCVKTEKNKASAIDLSEPIYYHDEIHPLVCFGGEASSYHHYGCVHGAVEAGLREADRIIKFKNLK